MMRFYSKIVYQKCVFFKNIENDYSLKIKQNQLCLD